MRVVVQRVRNAGITVDGSLVGCIEKGLLVYLGVSDSDDDAVCCRMADKISKLRIFRDDNGKMNLSVGDIGGSILVVSQFTLYANVRRGNRPSYDAAGKPEHANMMYEHFIDMLSSKGFHVEHGVFGAHMHVCYENDGPVTIVIDSDELKHGKMSLDE